MRTTLLFPALGVLLAVLGWPLAVRRVRPNRWYGLRVPATFADERVWYDANAITGRDLVALGTGVAAVSIGLARLVDLPPDLYTAICAGLLGVGSIILSVRGWVAANRLLRERRAGREDARRG
jgi:uncharacterized membrane protein